MLTPDRRFAEAKKQLEIIKRGAVEVISEKSFFRSSRNLSKTKDLSK